MMRILIVDDEPQMHRFLQPVLMANGYAAERADTGRAALRLMQDRDVNAILLDLGLPDVDGLEVLKRLRAASQVPVIIISARDHEAVKIAALDAGADDYLEKPFGVGEMLARLRTALRHHGSTATAGVTGSLFFKDLTIDSFRRLAYAAGKQLTLTPKEWELLLLFAGNSGRVLTHRQILKAIWGSYSTENVQYLRVYVGQLRKKLGVAGGLISTETGVGYRMAECLQTNGYDAPPAKEQ